MTRQSEQLEREVEQARADLASSLDALRNRLTPGQIVEEAVDYARETPVAEFARNVSRDVQANPMPLIIIFAGIVGMYRHRALIKAQDPSGRESERRAAASRTFSSTRSARVPPRVGGRAYTRTRRMKGVRYGRDAARRRHNYQSRREPASKLIAESTTVAKIRSTSRCC